MGGCCEQGGGCCGSKPFPWFSVLTDPTVASWFLRRYWRELLVGLGSGALASLAALTLGEALGGLGALLQGPYLHFHAGAVLPAALLGGLILSLGLANKDARPWTIAAWVVGFALLGGLGNGWLEMGDSGRPGGLVSAFLQDGGPASLLAFGLLLLPALAAARALLALPFKGQGHAGCQEAP